MSKLHKSKGVVIYDSESKRYYSSTGWTDNVALATIITSKKALRSKINFISTHPEYAEHHKINAYKLCIRRVSVKVKEEYCSLQDAMKEAILC